jgi:hypothetical protein
VLLADNFVTTLPATLTAEQLKGLITIAGGETVELPE